MYIYDQKLRGTDRGLVHHFGIRTDGLDGSNVTDTGEQCDDLCEVEVGWTCDGGIPFLCTAICGDGLIREMETCDDGNTA